MVLVVLEFACIEQGFAGLFAVSAHHVIVPLGVLLAEAAELAVLPFAVKLYLKFIDKYAVALGEPRRPHMTRICTCTESLACIADTVSDTVAYF